LSDVCNIENPIARGYLSDLYSHKMKGYIKYLIEHTLGDKDFSFGVPRLDRSYVDYKFSPAINACLRFNKEEEVVKFFLGSGKLDLSYHKRQKELVKDMVASSYVKEFKKLRVVFVKDWEVDTKEDISIISNFIGLIASRYLDGEKSVIAYVVSKDSKGNKYIKRGSFRGNINGANYLGAMEGYIVSAGHPSAFGIIKINPSKKLFTKLSNICEEVDNGLSYSKSITPTNNLSVFSNKNGKKYAEHNMYCLAQNSKFIQYNGKNISIKKEGANFIKYRVDGLEVLCFDLNLNFSTGLIYPILERGYLYFYLRGES
jgi:single-stranded-DNA-specific exonuclease